MEDVVYTDGFGRKLQEIQVHGAPDGTLSLRGYYPAGALQKTTVTDEDGHTAVTYTDNRDREVLTLQTADDGMKLETYRVYDDRGMLRWVLSPEATHQIQNSMDTDVLEELAYYYEYDALGRMTLKRLPGCMPTRMVYDRRNRMVMSQDGNQRQENTRKWCYSVYDDTNRVTETVWVQGGQADTQEGVFFIDAKLVQNTFHVLDSSLQSGRSHVSPQTAFPLCIWGLDFAVGIVHNICKV